MFRIQKQGSNQHHCAVTECMMDCQRGQRVSPVWIGTVGCLRGPRALVRRCLQIGLPAQWWHTGHEPTCERDKHRGKQQHRIQSNFLHQVQLDVMMTSENVGWGHRMIRLLHPHPLWWSKEEGAASVEWLTDDLTYCVLHLKLRESSSIFEFTLNVATV